MDQILLVKSIRDNLLLDIDIAVSLYQMSAGIESNENARIAFIREFEEEIQLDIVVEDFSFTNKYLDEQVHTFELFVSIREIGGSLKLGRSQS